MEIQLVRHGQSEANISVDDPNHKTPQKFGDHLVPLTPQGHQDALAAGKRIGADFIQSAMIWRSPYHRTRQTLRGILEGAGMTESQVRIYEDPQLREVEHGFEGDMKTVKD